jgi:hypothetical protein
VNEAARRISTWPVGGVSIRRISRSARVPTVCNVARLRSQVHRSRNQVFTHPRVSRENDRPAKSAAAVRISRAAKSRHARGTRATWVEGTSYVINVIVNFITTDSFIAQYTINDTRIRNRRWGGTQKI